MGNGSNYDNISFDALFGSHYDSEKDEDYDVKEDMIQNTKTYFDDRKPINFNISKAEVNYLLHEQKVDTLLFGDEQEDDYNYNDSIMVPSRRPRPKDAEVEHFLENQKRKRFDQGCGPDKAISENQRHFERPIERIPI